MMRRLNIDIHESTIIVADEASGRHICTVARFMFGPTSQNMAQIECALLSAKTLIVQRAVELGWEIGDNAK